MGIRWRRNVNRTLVELTILGESPRHWSSHSELINKSFYGILPFSTRFDLHGHPAGTFLVGSPSLSCSGLALNESRDNLLQ